MPKLLNSPRAGWMLKGLTAAAAMLIAGMVMPTEQLGAARAAETVTAAKTEPARTQDQIILSNGTTVKGQIVEENASSVTIMVEFPGMAPVRTTYQKSEVVKITHDVPAAPMEVKKEEAKTGDRVKDQQAPTASAEDAAAKMMIIKLEGELGRDISPTPMASMFAEVDKEFNDLDESGKVKPEFRRNHIVVLKLKAETRPSNNSFSGFFAAERLAPEFEKQFEKGRRVVFWIDEAVGGAAFLPMISPEIYWKPTGRLRGNDDLDKFDLGDKMVNEKQISLRLGHAEGIPIKGGYGEAGVLVVRALARKQNWLIARMEGGKPVFIDHEPKEGEMGEYNWTILKDNGEGKWKDSKKTEGNDFLVLEADWARNLGLSKGTCDTEEDLAFAFDIQRNYKVIEKPKAQKVLEGWSKEIENALNLIRQQANQRQPIGKLWEKFNDAEVTGDYNKRRAARGIKINTLKEIMSVVKRYSEVFDPEGQFVTQLTIRLKQLEEEADLDRRAQQRTGGR